MAVFKLIFMKEGKSKATIINVIIMVQFLKERSGIRTSIPSVFQTSAIDQTAFERQYMPKSGYFVRIFI